MDYVEVISVETPIQPNPEMGRNDVVMDRLTLIQLNDHEFGIISRELKPPFRSNDYDVIEMNLKYDAALANFRQIVSDRIFWFVDQYGRKCADHEASLLRLPTRF